MKYTIYTDVDGNLHRRKHAKPGPKARGYIRVLVDMPPEYVEQMRWINEDCGGRLAVNEQIRRAVRAYLCGLVYINLVKS